MFRLIASIKVRFFATEALLESLDLFKMVNYDNLPTDKLRNDVRMAECVVAGELARRNVKFW